MSAYIHVHEISAVKPVSNVWRVSKASQALDVNLDTALSYRSSEFREVKTGSLGSLG